MWNRAGKMTVSAAATALMATALVSPSAQAGTVACPSGFLCLDQTNGTVTQVPSGGSASYSPPLSVDLVANQASVGYCVKIGLIIERYVPPGATLTGNHSVYGVSPSNGICPG
jgi:hypothetical protein